MICTAHNLLKLFSLANAREPPNLQQMPVANPIWTGS
jgi:hypothetical protein